MKRTRTRMRPEIGKDQCDFFQDRTRNVIFMIGMLSERAMQMRKIIHMFNKLSKSI